MILWGAMSSAGIGPFCFLKTNVTAPVYQEILEHLIPSADQLFKDADFISQQDLAPAHTAKSTKSWLNDHGVGLLDWPAITSMPPRIEAVIQAKGALSTYTVNEHTFQKANNSLKKNCIALIKYSNRLR